MITALLLFACSEPEPTRVAAPAGDPRANVLVVGRSMDADVLVRGLQTSIYDLTILDAITTDVVRDELDCGIRWSPAWATGWTVNPEHTVLSMTLREGLVWEDGVPVTPKDLVLAAELAMDPKVASKASAAAANLVAGKAPLVLDATHIEWHFVSPRTEDRMLDAISAIGVVPHHRLEGADRATLRGHAIARAPLSSGPWRIERWDAGERLVLAPNPRHAERPHLEKVVFRVVPDYTARLLELETGGIDVMEGIQLTDAERVVKEHPEIRIATRADAAVDYVAWNLVEPGGKGGAHPLFGEVAVRRALAKAVDVEGIIREHLTGASGEPYGERAFSTISPNLCHDRPKAPTFLPFDPAAARAELEALGWVDADEDGVRERRGVPFRFKLLTNAGSPRRSNVAIVLQAAFRDVGVQMDVEQIEANTFFNKLRTKDFDAALTGLAGELVIDPSIRWRSGPDRVWNNVSYANPEVDALIDAFGLELDPERRRAQIKEIQERIYEDQPFLFLYWFDDLVAVHSRFQDARIDPLTTLGDLHRWRLGP